MDKPSKRDSSLQNAPAAGVLPQQKQQLPRPLNCKEIAALGEQYACEHLRSLGYREVCRNWRSGRFGEIDLIMKSRDGLLVFAP